MNLIEEISLKIKGEYKEDAPKSTHTPLGKVKSQKVYCETKHNNHRIKLVSNYQLGIPIETIDDNLFTIILYLPNRINTIEFYPKNKLEKFLRVGGSKGIKSKYSSKRDSITDRLILSRRFENLMLSNNVYLSTETNETKSTIILRAVLPVPNIYSLEELLEIITIISEKLQ